MNVFKTTLLSTCLALCASGAIAQDAMKKDDAMAKDGLMKKDGATSESMKK